MRGAGSSRTQGSERGTAGRGKWISTICVGEIPRPIHTLEAVRNAAEPLTNPAEPATDTAQLRTHAAAAELFRV